MIKDVPKNSTINRSNYGLLAYCVQNIYYDYRRKDEDGLPELSWEHILKGLRKQDYLFSDRKFNKKDIAGLCECLNKDTTYFTDYIFDENGISRKQYEPYKTLFETSGKIIVENDLRGYFDKDDFDINQTQGIIDTTDHYAKQGMLHGFVGNSCPTICLSEEKGLIHIGTEYDEELDDYKLPDDSFKELTSVCTDLWWYSIVDLETFQKNNPDIDTDNFTVVDIPKGTWELEHTYHISDISYHEHMPYAKLTKVK